MTLGSRIDRAIGVALLLLGWAAAEGPPPVLGAQIFVTSTQDGILPDGDCTLREAVQAANLNAPVDACAAGDPEPLVDTIVLTETEAPYRLSESGSGDALGDLDVFSSLEVLGAPSRIDATGLADRVLDVRGAVTVTLALVHLRGGDAGAFRGGGIRAGATSTLELFKSSVRGGRAAFGAGIAAHGAVVEVHDSEISHNRGAHAVDLAGSSFTASDSTVGWNQGAGVTAIDATVVLERSLLAGNTGSGLRAGGASTVTLRNTTISGNGSPDQPGGGLWIVAPAAVSSYYATITDNEASWGGGVHVTGSLTLQGSILGANRASQSHPDCYSEQAQMTSWGFNVLHRDDCEIVPAASDRVGQDPALDVLADWGGPTRSHRPLLGSPALDAGDALAFPAVDQRGEPRPRHGDFDAEALPDAGAHENANTIVVTTGSDGAGVAGECELREAVRAANTDAAVAGCRAGQERDLIWIVPAAVGDAVLAIGGVDENALLGDLDVLEDLDVSGLPHLPAIVDGGALDRVLEVSAPARLGLAHLDVRNGAGSAPGGGLRVGAGAQTALVDVGFHANHSLAGSGGAIEVLGEVTGEDVWFHGNTASLAGGAIAVTDPEARLLLRRASITANESTASSGGGVAVTAGTARLEDATVAGNEALLGGGGIFNQADLDLHSATIAYNVADSGGTGSGAGGGIESAGAGITRMAGSILAVNSGGAFPDCAGDLESGGHNLVQAPFSCSFGAAEGDLVGIAPGLGEPLGGVYSLLPSSPARDTGSPEDVGTLGTSCSRLDGAGRRRPADGDGDGQARCDIGAVEALGSGLLDVDGNGSIMALTDGLLVQRYLSGATGAALVAAAIGSGAERSSATEVAAHLEEIAPLLDVDGNGLPDGLTDGILVLRYLFGIRGPSLVEGVVGAGATRTTPQQVADYLDELASS